MEKILYVDVKVICNVRLFIEYRNDREPAIVTVEGILVSNSVLLS